MPVSPSNPAVATNKTGQGQKDRKNGPFDLSFFILVLLISYFFVKFKSNRYITAAMNGLRPMTVGLNGLKKLLKYPYSFVPFS